MESPFRWVAGLSNGETITEGRGAFEEISNEPSPWQKLLKYLEANNLLITSLQVQGRGHTWNLPSQKPRHGGEIPIAYNYKRKVVGDVVRGEMTPDERYIGIDAVYPSMIVTIWVDESDGETTWIEVKLRK